MVNKTSKYIKKTSQTKSSYKQKSYINSRQSSTNPIAFNNEIGINDLNGIHNNPLTGKPYENVYQNEMIKIDKIGNLAPATYANIAKNWSSKLVYKNKDAIIDSILQNQITVATASTGVGKTILIPRIALHAIKYKGTVVCTVPKRLSAKIAAEFVSKCMDSRLGEHVGYSYQGTNETNKRGVVSKLIFTTTGSLISRLTGSDPMLSNYKCIIVDEAHERSVETDQLLLLLKKLCLVRKDFKLVIMSATIAVNLFRSYFPKSIFKFGEIDAGTETSFKINEYYFDRPTDWKKMAVDISMKILRKTAVGDIMIFVKAGGDATQIITGINREMADYRKKISKGSGSRSGRKSKNHSKHNINVSRKTKTNIKNAIKIIPKEYLINTFCIKLDGKTPKKEQE